MNVLNGRMNKSQQKVAAYVISVLLAVVVVIGFLNIAVLLRMNRLEKEIYEQKRNLSSEIDEHVTEIFRNPTYMADGEDITTSDTETLINPEKLLTSEQMQDLRREIIDSVQQYVTDEVYLGVKELVITDLKNDIVKIVKENTETTLTTEQQDLLITVVKDMVIEETTESITNISEQITSNNKIVKSMETTVTSLKNNVATLEKTLDNSLLELKEKDKELEAAINKLRLSFVSSNVGTSSLSILSVQMESNQNILAECKSAVDGDLTDLSESDKTSYLATISDYSNQVKAMITDIDNALKDGNSNAGESLATKAADLSKKVVKLGTLIEDAKIDLSSVREALQDQIDLMNTNLSNLSLELENNKSKINQLQTDKESLTAAINVLENTTSSNLDDAISSINAKIGSLGAGTTVSDALSNTLEQLESAKTQLSEAIASGTQSAINEAEANAAIAISNAKAELSAKTTEIDGNIATLNNLITQMQEAIDSVQEALNDNTTEITSLKTAKDLLVAKDTELAGLAASLALADAAMAEANEEAIQGVIDDINAVIGTLDPNTTIAQELADTLSQLESAKTELSGAITTGNADAIATAQTNASALVAEAKAEINSTTSNLDSQITVLNSTVTQMNTSIEGIEEELDKKVEMKYKVVDGKPTLYISSGVQAAD